MLHLLCTKKPVRLLRYMINKYRNGWVQDTLERIWTEEEYIQNVLVHEQKLLKTSYG